MARLMYDSAAVSSKVTSSLLDSISSIKSAGTLCSDVTAPVEFSGMAKINNVANRIADVESRINSQVELMDYYEYLLDNSNNSVVQEFEGVKAGDAPAVVSIIK